MLIFKGLPIETGQYVLLYVYLCTLSILVIHHKGHHVLVIYKDSPLDHLSLLPCFLVNASLHGLKKRERGGKCKGEFL